MTKQIDEVLRDLYKIEPALRERDGEVRELVGKLLAARPDAKIDEVFLKELKDKLMAEAGRLSEAAPQAASIWDGLFANRFAFAVGVAALTLLVAVPAITLLSKPGARLAVSDQAKGGAKFALAPKLTQVAASAYGSLKGVNTAPAGVPAGRGGGGGGGVASLNATAESTAPVADMVGGDAKIGIMPPYYQNYAFKYVGEELASLNATAPVYKRVKDLSLGRQYAQSFTTRNFGYFNLDKFQDLELASVNFNETREFGYSTYFSLYDNSFGITANWEKWPHPEQECRDDACFQRYQLKISDVPADQELIAIANAFLAEYGIDMSSYGAPLVNKYWEREIQTMPDPANYYVPETVSVVYPLVLDGQTVKDEGGNPAGVYVDVNIRHKKGYGINNLFVPNFEKSDYAAVTDAGAIVKLAENGGNAWLYQDPNAADTVTLELGTPTVILMRYWWYDQTRPAAGGSQELYIPALYFPVVNQDAAKGYWRDSVTVPLVQEIFDQIANQENPGGPIMYMKGGATEPAAGEAEGGTVGSGEAIKEDAPAAMDELQTMITPEAR